VQGCILSGARRRPFVHNDWEAADRLLAQYRHEYRRVLLVMVPLVVLTGDAVFGRKYANTSTTLQGAIVLCKPDMLAACRPSPRTANKQMFTFHRHFLVSHAFPWV